ncbi:hypothetical protein WM42_0971 [Corynebacterium simulans]|nr:hypothetical protein WM42_0971 [Corynebacterium simulans]
MLRCNLLENVTLHTVWKKVWKTRDYMLKYKGCFNTTAFGNRG